MTKLVPLKRIARLKYGDALAADKRTDGPYPVVGSGGASGTHISYNFRAPGIVVGRKGSFGSVHWFPDGGFAIDTAYFVDETCSSAHLRWLYYALQAVDLKGVSQDVGVPGLSRESAYEVILPAISTEEQSRVAALLDAETARMDAIDNARYKQIELLRERERAELDALFLGLKSGVPTRLKRIFKVRPRYGVLVPEFADEGVPFIRVNDLLDLDGRAEGLRKIPATLSAQYARTVVQPGDLLVSVVGTLGRSAVAPECLQGANIARAVCSVRVARGVEVEVFQAWLGTTAFRSQSLTATSTDTAQPTLGMEDFSNFSANWPIDESEQQDLLTRIRSMKISFSALKNQLERQRVVLAERRQAFVAAVVMGEIDVSTASGRGIED